MNGRHLENCPSAAKVQPSADFHAVIVAEAQRRRTVGSMANGSRARCAAINPRPRRVPSRARVHRRILPSRGCGRCWDDSNFGFALKARHPFPSRARVHRRILPGRRCGRCWDDSNFGFALKARHPFGVGRKRWREDLDCDLPLQLGVGRPINLPHSAFADLRRDLVDAKARTGS